MRVLVVEDEPALREQLCRQLGSQGYVVDCSGDGPEGLYMGRELPVDLAVVDLGLPGLGGIEVVRAWRRSGIDVPILILTVRGGWQDKVLGLEAGADDYLVKPFHIEELLARVRALVRRSGHWSTPLLTCGPVQLDTAAQRVTRHGAAVEVTAFEYRLLEYLMLHAGRVVSKLELSDHCYDEGCERDSNVVEVLVGRLRRKIDPDGAWKPIETLRGRGYRLSAERLPPS